MAARTITLDVLRADLLYLADIPSSSTRHTTANLNRILNKSWQRMRAMVSDNGHQAYLKAASGTLTAGLTSPYPFGTLSLPDDLASLYGFHVTVATNDIRPVDVVPFSQVTEYQTRFGGSTGIPTACHIYNIGTESTTTVTAGKLAILPAPQAAYAYTLWYLPIWVDISDGNSATYVFNGLDGWEDWVLQDAVCMIAERDNDMAATYQIAQLERAKAEARILNSATRLQRIGPATRVDAARRERIASRQETFRRP